MSAPLIYLAIDVAVAVCAMLIAVRALTLLPWTRAGLLIAALSVGMVCAVVLGRQDYAYWEPAAFRLDVGRWAPALNLARNLAPGLLMLLCRSLFTERRRVPTWLFALLALQLLLEEPGRELVPASWRFARALTQTAPALLQTLFVSFAIWWTLEDWRADLVEARRRTRGLMLIVIGLSTVVTVLFTRVLINPDRAANYIAHVALTASYLPIQVFVLFHLGGSLLADVAGVAALQRTPAPRADEARASAQRLRALLEDEQVCQKPGLTLEALAQHVGLPVYRLRRLIHEDLGYRNFNALLHDYRIREACRQLSDPELRRTPILTIALTVGYSSANTFNRGFREIMRVTPSDYRALALGEAGAAAEVE